MMKQMLLAAGLVALGGASAQAATINVSAFSKAAYDATVGGFGSAVIEDFESFTEKNVPDGWSDSVVGSFHSLGGTGTGGTVTSASGNIPGNDGSKLALRDGNVYGRQSTTKVLSGNAADDMFLDSNDTYGIKWIVSLGGAEFNRLVFTLTDATDVGAIMKITTGGMTETLSGLGNGVSKLVDIAFNGPVTTATILFANEDANGDAKKNDGFSIDDIALSAVPLPAGAWFLLGSLGALAGLRRRKQRATA